MKKLIIFLLPALFLTITSSAQTKRIAHLSHAGKLSTLNSKSEGNFGETPEMRRMYNKHWDSIYRADSARLADSIAKKYQKPKADSAARQINSGQLMPGKNPKKAGSWLGKSH